MAARRKDEALPATLAPQLATLVDRIPPGDWLYEIKYDGYRLLMRVEGGDVRLHTREGNDWTLRFPTLLAEAKKANLPAGWYDGEIVVLDERGRPDFGLLQNAIDGARNKDIAYFVFDAPFLSGEDLRELPLDERRGRLAAAWRESAHLRLSEALPWSPRDLLASACKLGLEGIVAKRRRSRYASGRSQDWLKLKCTEAQEFVIVGWVPPEERDTGIAKLLLGYRPAGGTADAKSSAARRSRSAAATGVHDSPPHGELRYAGSVEKGFSGEQLAQLQARLAPLATRVKPVAEKTGYESRATWVEPRLVCEVQYTEWTRAGRLRHSSFKGLREDKPARAVVRERPAKVTAAGSRATSGTLPRAASAPKPSVASRARPASSAADPPPTVLAGGLTSPHKVIDVASGFTKLDLATYYVEAAPWLLPFLRGRPLYVRRAPGGIQARMFFQQHPDRTREFRGTDPELWPGHDPAIAIETVEELLTAVQIGTIELHTWNSTSKAITLPDRLIFDIDPGEKLPWQRVREAAVLTRALLDEVGLESWVRTTGGKGLHVVVPIKPEFDYPTAKGFSYAVVRHLARTFPDRFVTKSGASNRQGRIFIDFLRNGQSQSTAEAYSARARPGMGVSMPIAWDELERVSRADEWDIRSALDRLRAMKEDPWAAYWKKRQSIARGIKVLKSERLD